MHKLKWTAQYSSQREQHCVTGTRIKTQDRASSPEVFLVPSSGHSRPAPCRITTVTIPNTLDQLCLLLGFVEMGYTECIHLCLASVCEIQSSFILIAVQCFIIGVHHSCKQGFLSFFLSFFNSLQGLGERGRDKYILFHTPHVFALFSLNWLLLKMEVRLLLGDGLLETTSILAAWPSSIFKARRRESPSRRLPLTLLISFARKSPTPFRGSPDQGRLPKGNLSITKSTGQGPS